MPRLLLYSAFIILHSAFVSAQSTRPADPLEIERALLQLNAPDWILQWEAMTTLAKAKSPAAAAPLEKIIATESNQPFTRGRALVALSRIAPGKAAAPAKDFASSKDSQLRAAAAESLGLIAADAAVVEKLLSDESQDVRNEAIVAVARTRRSEAMPLVAQRLAKGQDALTQRAAVRALPHVGTDEAWTKLTELLDSKDKGLRHAAVRALGETSDPRAIRPLLNKLATDPDKTLAVVARSALSNFDYARLAAPLMDALNGDDPRLYPVALSLLSADLDPAACKRVAERIDDLDQRSPESLAPALKLLSRCDPDAHGPLFVRFVDHKLPDARKAAIDAISRATPRDVDLFSLLQDRLVDEDKSVRAAAYAGLRRGTRGIPRGGIVPYLAKPLASPDRAVHTPAIELLRERLGKPEVAAAVAALDPFLSGPDKESRKLAATVLEQYADEPTLEVVNKAQGFPSPWLLIGPFVLEEGQAFDTPLPPEREIDLAKAYETAGERKLSWSVLTPNRADGLIDLSYIYQPAREGDGETKATRVVYGAVDLLSDADRPATLNVTTQGAFALWLNGAKLPLKPAAEQPIDVALRRGRNTLLVKSATESGRGWSYRIQLSSKAGHRIPGVTTAVPGDR